MLRFLLIGAALAKHHKESDSGTASFSVSSTTSRSSLAVLSSSSRSSSRSSSAQSSSSAVPSSFVHGNDTFVNGTYSDPLMLWQVSGDLNGYANASADAPALPHRTSQLTAALFPKLYAAWKSAGERWPAAVADSMFGTTESRSRRLSSSVGCSPLPYCVIGAAKLAPDEVDSIGDALAQLDGELGDVWPRYAVALNYIMDVYGSDGTATYPEDSFSYAVNGTNWMNEVLGLQSYYLQNYPSSPFDAVFLAMDLLDANDRVDSIADADAMLQLNAPAVDRARRLGNWSDYQYAAVVIPGEGPDDLSTTLSPESKLRARLAMQMLSTNPKLAPFVVTTGGYVHPARTTHNEGLNLRQWLIEQYGVRSETIIVEPHARHTTTNLRNAARELMALQYPRGMKVLVVTDPVQRAYIASPGFANRAVTQLGYSLGDIGPFREPWGIEYTPSPNVTFVDPMDPLDP